MSLINLLPELILFLGALAILMIDVFFSKKFKDQSRIALVLSFAITATALFAAIDDYGVTKHLFNNMLFVNKFTAFAKIVIIILLMAILIISEKFLSLHKKISAEFVALIMIATTGSMLLISANDLLSFYLALELQSLALYVLAAIKRDSGNASESGMKYFLLGSVSSATLLLGISFVYGFSGTTNLNALVKIMNYYQSASHIEVFPVGLLLGLILIFVAILFKVSAAPFHMWTPDVYQGSASNVTAFFASVVKFTTILVMLKIYFYIIYYAPGFDNILVLIAILSLIIGSFGALKQNNIKRMLAYSSIGHVGFIIAGLLVASFEAIKAVMLYGVIYGSLSIAAFAIISMLQLKNNSKNLDIDDNKKYDLSSFSAISKTNPYVAFFLAITMFSMAGIPPMAGFFAKFYILSAIVEKGFYYLAIIAVISSVISAFYYLRVIKIAYFDDKNDNIVINSKSMSLIVLSLAALFNLFFIAFLKQINLVISGVFN